MKKIILILLAVVIIIVSVIGIKYYSYMVERNNVMEENAEYEEYINKEVYGINIATLINKTIDKNERNEIEKIIGLGTEVFNNTMRLQEPQSPSLIMKKFSFFDKWIFNRKEYLL